MRKNKSDKENCDKTEGEGQESVKDTPVGPKGKPRRENSETHGDAAEKERKERASGILNEVNPDSVTQLAGHILSAQIIAIENHRIASHILDCLRRSGLGEYLKSDLPSPGFLSSEGVLEVGRMARGAMKQSYMAILAQNTYPKTLYAEQIFDPDELLSEGEIQKRFKIWNWPGLCSVSSVNSVMTAIDKWFSEYSRIIERKDADGEEELDEVSVLQGALEICEKYKSQDESSSRVFASAGDALRAVIEEKIDYLEYERAGRGLVGVYQRIFDAEEAQFIRYIFEWQEPQERFKGRVSEGKSNARRYRAWALFRYIRLNSSSHGDSAKYSIFSKLWAKTDRLSPSQSIVPLDCFPEEFPFGNLKERMEEEIDSIFADENNLYEDLGL